ncbi:MAG TPA: hypothetical protein VMJ74_12835, partial [Pseudomonadales bacterium]|nr:hypothetical protein [Pseudomonadales bacterium]
MPGDLLCRIALPALVALAQRADERARLHNGCGIVRRDLRLCSSPGDPPTTTRGDNEIQRL